MGWHMLIYVLEVLSQDNPKAHIPRRTDISVTEYASEEALRMGSSRLGMARIFLANILIVGTLGSSSPRHRSRANLIQSVVYEFVIQGSRSAKYFRPASDSGPVRGPGEWSSHK